MANHIQTSYLYQVMSGKPNKKGLNATLPRQTLYYLVPEPGIEPGWAQGPEDFESSASTSFTTPALRAQLYLSLNLYANCQRLSMELN